MLYMFTFQATVLKAVNEEVVKELKLKVNNWVGMVCPELDDVRSDKMVIWIYG